LPGRNICQGAVSQQENSAGLPNRRHILAPASTRPALSAGAGKLEREMKFLTESYRGLSRFVAINTDRLLVPVLIVASLTLAGWLVSLLQAL
jgi:hypothetical protein